MVDKGSNKFLHHALAFSESDFLGGANRLNRGFARKTTRFLRSPLPPFTDRLPPPFARAEALRVCEAYRAVETSAGR